MFQSSTLATPTIGQVEQAAALQPVQRSEGHHLGQVAGDAEDDQYVGRLCGRASGPQLLPRTSRCAECRSSDGSSSSPTGGAAGVELLGPGEEGLHLGAGVGQQLGVHAEPGGEGDPAVQLVAVRADLGDGRLPADHRHDALVVVVERRAGRAVESARMLRAAQCPACWATLTRAAAGPCRRRPGCWRSRRGRTPRGSRDGQVGPHVDPPAPAGAMPACAASGAAISPPAQTTSAGRSWCRR